MFLKIFYPSGGIKYSGWRKQPKIKRGQKLYDIGGIMLWMFESKFIICYDEKGYKVDQGIVTKGKITKTVKKDDTNNFYEFDENYSLSASDFSDEYTIESDDTYSNFYSYQGETFENIPSGKGVLKKNGKIDYVGHFLDGKKHGMGITFMNDKKFHYGNYVENEFHGNGRYYHPDLQTIIFEGKFKRGAPFVGKFFCNETNVYSGFFKNFCGEFCHLYDNRTYIGHFKNGKRDGYGEFLDLTDNMEDTYRGYWKNDVYHGKGVLRNNNGNIRYDGEWKYGMKDGFGQHYMYFCGGYIEKYVGDFKQNKKHGYGIDYEGYNDVDTDKISYIKEYSGWWENDEKNGDGLCYHNGLLFYEGEMKDDNENGFGRRFYQDGTLQYEGYFKDNDYNGIGKLFYIDGTTCFDGNWKDGIPYYGTFYNFENGTVHQTKIIDGDYYTKGVLIEPEGDGTILYRGEFKNGLCHGEAVSDSYKGNYKDGKYHGQGTYYCASEDKYYKGQFLNGYFWDGKILKLLEYNQIIYEGTMKEEKYDTGTETILNDDPYYEYEPMGYRKWKNGVIVNEQEERKKIRQNMLISSFLETRNRKFLQKVDRKSFLEFLKENYNMQNIDKKSKKQLVGIIEKMKLELKQAETEEKIDLFGNEIVNPVRGTDEEIYDESSMLYLFEKDENDDFKNISYVYGDKGERIPNFPVTTNGKILKGYAKF